MSDKQSKFGMGGDMNQAHSFSGKWVTGAAILLLILVWLTYSGAFKNGFVGWDDREYVIDNQLVRSGQETHWGEIFSTIVSLNYHPLTILTLHWNDNSCANCPDGISAKPFIAVNILLHSLNTLLVFLLIYLLFSRNLLLSLIVAAIFAVHPMHVESVAWISARKDVLSSFFFLSGLLAWLHYLPENRRKHLWLAFSFFLFVLACLSKATAVVFPVVAILVSYFVSYREVETTGKGEWLKLFDRRKMLVLLPYFVVSLFFGLIALRIQGGENFLGWFKFSKTPDSVINIVAPFSWLQRLQIGCYGFWVYLIKFILPIQQSCFYPYPEVAEMGSSTFQLLLWSSLFGFIVLFSLVIYSLKQTRLYFFSFGFALVTLLLVLQFISVGKAILAERYTYLPYIGLAIVPAAWVANYRGNYRKGLLLLAGAFVLVLLLVARDQVKVWKDTDTLWSQSIDNQPEQELAWRARGKYFYGLSAQADNAVKRKNLEEKAMADFKVAVLHKTASADVYEGMGMMLLVRGDAKSALKLLNLAISLSPANGRIYYNRAIIYDQMNQKMEAIHDYDLALERDPKGALAILRNRSALCLETGNYAKALQDCNGLVQMDGGNFIHYYNRAFAKVMLKDYEGAIADYQIVMKLNPGDKQTAEQLRLLNELKKSGR